MLPPAKNRSGPQVLPLRSTKVLVEPAIIRKSPPSGDTEPSDAGAEGDLASTVIGLAACVRHHSSAPITTRAATPQAATGPLNQRGCGAAGASIGAGASASTSSGAGGASVAG